MNRQSDIVLRITNSPTGRGGGLPAPAVELILSVLLFLALGGAVTAAVSAPSAALAAPVALGAAVCALAAFSGGRPWGKFVSPALLVAALVLTLALRGRVTEGTCLLWNDWCAALTAATGRLRLGVAASGAGADANLRTLLLIAAAGLALGAVWLRRACPHLAAALCLVLAVALSLLPALPGVGVRIALALIAGLALTLVPDARTGGGFVQRLLPLALAAALFALLLLGVRALAPVRDGSFFTSLRRQAADAVHAARYEPEAQPLPEGGLTRAGAKPDGATVRLTVTMTQPETLYLRGFVGDTYDGTSWQPLANATLAGNADLLYWLHRSGFYPQTQASLAASLLDGGAALNTVAVNNLAACSKYVYAPWSLARADGLYWLSVNDLNGSALTSAARRGARAYRYAAVYEAPDRAEAWVAAFAEGEGAELDAYRAEEAGYRDFVRANDLALPESVRSLLAPTLDAVRREVAGAEEMTPTLAAACVERFLETKLTYREDVPRMDASGDFAAWTLEQGGGWDVHSATLAVLALRYYGVPARYAEGYVVRAAAAEAANGGEIALTDADASAWAEVYQEGIGWLPLAQTTGNAPASGDAAAGGSPTAANREPDETSPVGMKEAEASETPPPDEPDPAEVDEPEPPDEEPDERPDERDAPPPETNYTPPTRPPERSRWLRWALAALLVVAAAAAVLALRRRHILRRRERLFGQENAAEAVSCLFAYVLRLLEPLAIAPEKGRLTELPPLLAEKLAPDYAERFRRMTELNYRALFCSRPLPDGAREEMAALRQETQERLRRAGGFWKHLMLKWVKCLY